jgi:tRNA modification GTPase
MRWCTCACWSRPRWTSREEIDFLQKPTPRASWTACRRSWAGAGPHPAGALLRGHQGGDRRPAQCGQELAAQRAGGAELAIVTPIAGTTRDKVQQTIQIEGVPLHVIDTAGLRDSDDEVERIGIARAWDEIAAADAVLFLHDLSRTTEADYAAADLEIAQTLAERILPSVPVIDLWNKIDLAAPARRWSRWRLWPAAWAATRLSLSARTGEGLDAVRQRLLQVAGWQSAAEGLYIARARHGRRCRPWSPPAGGP